MNEEEILKAIDTAKEEIINFCQKLIQTDSVNPPGNELNVAKVISKFLEENGIESEIFELGNNRANLIATLKGAGDKRLLLNGHMDVVPIENEKNWVVPPFSASIKRKRIIGRGAVDMKGPLAAMISAFVILKRLNFPLKGNLILNCVSDEEVLGEIGTKWCITNYPEKMRADAVIVCEPSGLDPLPKAILIGEKGRLEVQIITHGISYHAGMPALGVNAFEMFNKIFNNIHKLNSYISPVIPPFSKDELKSMLIECFGTKEIFEKIYEDNSILQALIDALSNFTCTLSIVKAGLKENVGPGECTAILDIRLVQGQDSKEIINGLKKLINDVGYPIKSPDSAAKNELYVELKINSLSEPSIVDRYDYEIIDILKNTYKEIYHKKTFKFLMPATTDARFFRNSGFCKQTVVFGPGNATQAHSKNEYIDIKDLINATKTYALVAARFLK